ncbi:MAG: hypothetical protein ACYC2P_05935 [Paludibacteraceae bacterium]
MKTLKIKLLLLAAFSCFVTVNAQNLWKILGEAVPAGSADLIQNPSDPAEYIYRGKLSGMWFKITNGTNTYVPICRENDPLGNILDAHIESSTAETGFRIRYSTPNDFYKVSFREGRSTSKISVERITPPEKIYLAGGPVNTHDPNWLLSDARDLEKDASNPFIFYYKGFLRYNTFGDEPGSIKFLIGLNWDTAYHPYGSTDVPLAQASKMREGGTDTKWTIPADRSGDGYYIIKINTFDQTINIVEFDPNAEYFPANIYITGDAMPCGWTNVAPVTMIKQTEKGSTYFWTGNLTPGQFKFLKEKGTWGSGYAATKENDPIVFGQSQDIVYEFEYWNGGGNDYKFVVSQSEQVTIQVDLKTMKMIVINDLTGVSPVEKQSGFHLFSKNGKVYVKNTAENKFHMNVFGIGGHMILNRNFQKDCVISLNNGMYIVELQEDESGVYRQKVIVK